MADEQDKPASSKRTRAVVDRIEDGGTAVVELGGGDGALVNLPASLLPEGAGDGDHLVITVALDKGSRADAADRIKSLRERLEKRGASSGQKDFKL